MRQTEEQTIRHDAESIRQTQKTATRTSEKCLEIKR